MQHLSDDERALEEGHARDEDHDARLAKRDRDREKAGLDVEANAAASRELFRNMDVDELIARCNTGEDDEACRELERRGIEPPLIPVTDTVEDTDLSPFQTRVMELLAEEWASVGCGRTASGAAVFSCYAEASDEAGYVGRPEGVVLIAADDTASLVDGPEVKRRIFLSADGFARVEKAWAPNNPLSDRLKRAERVDEGYVVPLDEIGVDHVRELGIGIVDYVPGLTPEQVKARVQS